MESCCLLEKTAGPWNRLQILFGYKCSNLTFQSCEHFMNWFLDSNPSTRNLKLSVDLESTETFLWKPSFWLSLFNKENKLGPAAAVGDKAAVFWRVAPPSFLPWSKTASPHTAVLEIYCTNQNMSVRHGRMLKTQKRLVEIISELKEEIQSTFSCCWLSFCTDTQQTQTLNSEN